MFLEEGEKIPHNLIKYYLILAYFYRKYIHEDANWGHQLASDNQ
jgi:hypothetical protein